MASAKTVTDLDTLQENAPMWIFATIADFLGIFLPSAPPNQCTGTVESQDIWQAIARTREYATHVGLPGTERGIALHQRYSPRDLRLCNNCYKQGHLAAKCTNDKACNNCRKTGHIGRDCPNDPVCNLCNVSGHLARACPKSYSCRNCEQVGHLSRDCMGEPPFMICYNCDPTGYQQTDLPRVITRVMVMNVAK